MIKDYFNFSPGEQRAIFILMLILVALTIWRLWPIKQDQLQVEITYLPKQEQEVERASNKGVNSKKSYTRSPNKVSGWKLHTFDINYAKARDLREMGFSSTFISNWFRKKSDVRFVKSKEQFRELRMLSHADEEIVLPFLDFSRYEKQGAYKTSERTNKKPQELLDINLADSASLDMLPGIGPVLSARIVKYRNRLGGFWKIQQLEEVYGVDGVLANKLAKRLKISGELSRLDVNSLGERELSAHPYVSRKQAGWIVRYREQHQGFNEVADLLRIKTLDSAWFQKVLPYLTIKP